MTLLNTNPQDDSRLGMKKRDCFYCLNSIWRHSPGHYWYPNWSACKVEECKPHHMSSPVQQTVRQIHTKYSKEGRIKQFSKP